MFLALVPALLSTVTVCDTNSRTASAGPQVKDTGSAVAPDPAVVLSAGSDGEWSGIVGATTALHLVITSGEKHASLTYGGSRACTAEGNDQSGNTDTPVFALTSQTGGVFCDTLETLTVKKTAPNELFYSVTFSGNKANEDGLLIKKP